MLDITKQQLINTRESLLLQVSRVEGMLNDMYGWRPDTAEIKSSQDPSDTIASSQSNLAKQIADALRESDEDAFQPPISYTKEAQEWVKEVSGKVTIADFAKWLKAKYPNQFINMTSLNSPIRKLVESQKLDVLHKGSGKRASVYCVYGDI